MKKLIRVGLVIFLAFGLMAPPVAAHDGSHSYPLINIQPRYGTSKVYYMSESGRDIHYVYHRLYWDSSSQNFSAYYDANAYGGNFPAGMEIDTHFYGYDNYVFGYGPRSKNQTDKGTYWNSNVPYAFIDTDIGDNMYEPGAGLGSGKWLNAAYNTWYFAETDFSGQTTHKDDFKVLVARSHHHNYTSTPQGSCSGVFTNPWCYYTDGPSSEAVHNWNGKAPVSSLSWNYPGQYSTVSPSRSGNWPNH